MLSLETLSFQTTKEEGTTYGAFTIGPLPKGYGVTIGNSLRRILLSSVEGAAITSVTITGVKHEYSTIPGVMDDCLTILLHLKQLALRSHSSEPQILELKVSGKKTVTGADIKLTGEVEISNKDLVITQLTESKAKLEIFMTVEKGIGYSPTDEGKRGQLGVIPLDAHFSPVQRVILNSGKTRVGQQTDLDQIVLEIFTNGTLTPHDAMLEAAEIYSALTTKLLSTIKGEETKEEKEETTGTHTVEESVSSDLDIDKLNLSARLTNSLLKSGYKNLTELENKTIDEIMEIKGLGKRSAEELLDIMKSYKLVIKDSH